MHIDFCFIDDRGRCLVAGWSSDPDPRIGLMVGGQRLSPVAIRRFPRRDLGNRQEQGLMASFQLRDAARLEGELPEIVLIANGELKELPAERLAQDEERLITSGVDELFTAYLGTVAAGTFGRPGCDNTQAILNRIHGNLRPLPAETPGIAVNLERLLVSPSGLGVFIGWCMTDRAHPDAVSALVTGGKFLNSATILLNSLRREDLAAYRGRYRYTGTDGFCGTFRIPMTAGRDVRVVLLSNVPNAGFVFGREAEPVSDMEAAMALCELRSALTDPRAAQVLTAGASPRQAGEPFSAPQVQGLDDAVSVFLDVDVEPVELRDVLRLLHVTLGRGYTVHLLGRDSGEMSRPVAAAVAEAQRELRVGEPLTAAQLLTHDFGRGWVIYGRASAFFQMPLPVFDDPGSLRVAFHDPVGALPGSPQVTGWRGDRTPPFLLAAAAPLLAAGLRSVARGFLTPEGVMRAAIDLLSAQGFVRAERAGGPTWFPATELRRHPEYSIACALDTEMRALVAEGERT